MVSARLMAVAAGWAADAGAAEAGAVAATAASDPARRRVPTMALAARQTDRTRGMYVFPPF